MNNSGGDKVRGMRMDMGSEFLPNGPSQNASTTKATTQGAQVSGGVRGEGMQLELGVQLGLGLGVQLGGGLRLGGGVQLMNRTCLCRLT